MRWTEARKFVVAVVGALGVAVTQGLIDGTAAKWVAVIIALASSLGVYAVKNEDA